MGPTQNGTDQRRFKTIEYWSEDSLIFNEYSDPSTPTRDIGIFANRNWILKA